MAKAISLRDMYFFLINIEQYPDILPAAKQFVEQWLTLSSVDLFSGPSSIPFMEYSHENIRAWLDSQAKVQMESYEHAVHEITKSREEVIEEAIQLCPMIFIDGAWLQKWGNAGLIDTKIGSMLFKIYSDEVGNGDTQLNHPNVYKNLMGEMKVDMPQFGSKEFAHWSGFDDRAFKVPVFWLCISQFPRQFMPETLGLNLAMEISGVGGAYRQARDELRHYGFSTLFVELHNSIDNVSTGHTAIARQAIEYYMEEISYDHNPFLINEQWKRIWTGYRSLVPPTKSWRSLLPWRRNHWHH